MWVTGRSCAPPSMEPITRTSEMQTSYSQGDWPPRIECEALASAATPRWYAAQTIANHERRVASQLCGRAVEHFLPVYQSMRHWSDRRVCLARPLFPGYVFVHLPRLARLRVLEVPGVVRLVSFGGRPASLDDREIAAIERLLSMGYRAVPHPYLRVGRRVHIADGPLRGIEGIIVRRKNRARFVVSVDLISRAMAVEVTEAELEPRF